MWGREHPGESPRGPLWPPAMGKVAGVSSGCGLRSPRWTGGLGSAGTVWRCGGEECHACVWVLWGPVPGWTRSPGHGWHEGHAWMHHQAVDVDRRGCQDPPLLTLPDSGAQAQTLSLFPYPARGAQESDYFLGIKITTKFGNSITKISSPNVLLT